MAALGAHACRLEPGRTRTHDDHPAGSVGALDDMRHRQLAAGGRVVDAQRLARLVDAVEAVGCAHAGADGVLGADLDLAHQMRLGHLGAGHADEVDQTLAHGVPCGGDVVDLRRVQHRHVGRHLSEQCLHSPGHIEVRRRRHAVDGDHLGEGHLVGHVAADDVDEIDQPVGAHPAQHRQARRLVEAVDAGLVQSLVDRHAQAQHHIGPDAAPDGVQDVEREAHPVLDRPAVQIGTPVGGGRPELVEQVPVRLDLDAVHAARNHALGSVGVLADDAVDVPLLGFLRVVAVGGFAQARRRHHG